MSSTYAQVLPFPSIDRNTLDQVAGGVDWGKAFESAKNGAEIVGAGGAAVGAGVGGVIGAGAGAVAVPGVGAVPGWVAGGLAKGIYDTWGK